MKPWIDEIKNGIVRIINQLKNTYGIGKLRLSFIGYRDYDDENNNLGEKRIEKLKFTCDIFEFESYIKSIKCIGGGEAAEDVLGGILESISGILWEAPIRILYHICDAPPHGICYHNYFEDIQKQLEQQYINNINDEKDNDDDDFNLQDLYSQQVNFQVYCGIDFGTSGSGFAYSLSGTNKVYTDQNWNNNSKYVDVKTKTNILLDNKGNCIAFGDDATDKYPQNFSSYSSFASGSEEYDRAVAAVMTTKWLILISSFVGIILAFIYLRAVACIGRFLIWITILVVGVGGIMLSVLMIQRGVQDMDDSETEDLGKIEVTLGAILMLILIMIWLSLWFIRKRIRQAIEMLDEASHAIQDIKTTLLFPCIYSFVGLIYFLFWIFVLIYIYSVQKKHYGTVPSSLVNIYLETHTFVYYTWDTAMKNSIICHFMCLFYMVQVIIYFGFMVLSGAIADWYFSDWNMEKNSKVRGYNTAELSYSPILESFFRVLRFHLGSLALGALIITIIRIIRACVTYIEAKTKGAQNPVTKCLFCCVQCGLKCCQCIFDSSKKR